ncbi:hypothetical protein GS504_01515 [Rhodococcus hoagii]|nr:hypothetical protein [Prescottella equi]
MAWSEHEIDEVLDETIRLLRGTGDTDGGMYLTVPAAELAKEHMNVLGDLVVEHVDRRSAEGYSGSQRQVTGTGWAFTIVDRSAVADDGVEYVATFVDVVTAAETCEAAEL